MPKCSFIVSAYDRPDALALLLLSLKLQTEPDFEVIICDNAAPGFMNFSKTVREIVRDDIRFRLRWTYGRGCRNCYQSANWETEEATGDYLCFPSDDGYYVPNFLKFMLKTGADLITCDWVTDVRASYAISEVIPEGTVLGYDIRHAKPCVNWIDKGGFLVRRSKFQPFPWEENIITADGLMVSRLLQDPTLTVDKAPGVLWVHN